MKMSRQCTVWNECEHSYQSEDPQLHTTNQWKEKRK